MVSGKEKRAVLCEKNPKLCNTEMGAGQSLKATTPALRPSPLSYKEANSEY